jgi:hypothetical protein
MGGLVTGGSRRIMFSTSAASDLKLALLHAWAACCGRPGMPQHRLLLPLPLSTQSVRASVS